MRPKDGGRRWCELGGVPAGRGESLFGKLRLRRWRGTMMHSTRRQLAV